jgi:hypothetical protein
MQMWGEVVDVVARGRVPSETGLFNYIVIVAIENAS